MSNVFSRRSFIKGATVMAVAVAACGIMAGCATSTKEVVINFYSSALSAEGTEEVVGTSKIEVNANDTSVAIADVQEALPTGFALSSEDAAKSGLEITTGESGNTVRANVVVASDYKVVRVTYYAKGSGEVGAESIVVSSSDTAVELSKLTLPDGYKVADDADYTITTFRTATIYVTKQ